MIPDRRKDPDETKDFLINWAIRLTSLDSDTISSSSWVAEDGITIDSDTNTTTTATVWLSGGTIKEFYLVTNTIVTDGGRTLEQSIRIHMVAA